MAGALQRWQILGMPSLGTWERMVWVWTDVHELPHLLSWAHAQGAAARNGLLFVDAVACFPLLCLCSAVALDFSDSDLFVSLARLVISITTGLIEVLLILLRP